MNKVLLISVVLLDGCSSSVTPATSHLQKRFAVNMGVFLERRDCPPTDFIRILCKDGMPADITRLEVSK